MINLVIKYKTLGEPMAEITLLDPLTWTR